jgi:hypothetical protein
MPEALAQPQGSWWRETGASALIAKGASISKKTDGPEYSVGLGAQVFSSGQHEFDFVISRHSDGVVYVGVAVPDIAVDKTWCRRDAANQVWYYFGTGFTNALRNGWTDVVSKEVGGAEMKVPKLNPGDKVRVSLDMDAGELRFAKFSLDEGTWKDMPGKVTGINVPVVAACCIQEKGDGVTLSEGAKYVPKEGDPGFAEAKKRVNKYSHVQSKLSTILSSAQDSEARKLAAADIMAGGGEGTIQPSMQRRINGWAVKAARSQGAGVGGMGGGEAKRERRHILSQASVGGGIPRRDTEGSWRRDAESGGAEREDGVENIGTNQAAVGTRAVGSGASGGRGGEGCKRDGTRVATDRGQSLPKSSLYGDAATGPCQLLKHAPAGRGVRSPLGPAEVPGPGICLSVCLSVYLSVYLSIYIIIHLYIYISIL